MEKLSTLCIDCIAKNFDRFMFTYESGNYIPNVYFEYLQRACSVPLLQKMLATDEWKNYIDFLLNPYIGEIDLRRADDGGDVTPIINRLIDIGPTITSLHLPDSNYNNSPLVELFPSLINVQSLILDGENISPDVFRSIGRNCHNLENLILCIDATDKCIEALYIPDNDGVSELNFNKALRCLRFHPLNTTVTTRSLKYVLKNFKGISFLEHDLVFDAIYEILVDDLKNENLDSMRKYNLQKLTIFINHLISKFPIELWELCSEIFPQLTTLCLYGLMSQAQVDALKIFPKLEEVFFHIKFSHCDLSSFLQLNGNGLKKLRISGGTVSLNSLSTFCPNLKYLEISYSKCLTVKDDITVSDCSLKRCKDLLLHSFDFRENITTQYAKHILSLCPNLENLTIYECNGVSLDFVHFITPQNCVKTLKQLYFKGTDIEFLAIKFIIENASNLKIVSCSGANFAANDIESLKLLNPSIKINF